MQADGQGPDDDKLHRHIATAEAMGTPSARYVGPLRQQAPWAPCRANIDAAEEVDATESKAVR